MLIMAYFGAATAKVTSRIKTMSDDIDFMVYTGVSSFTQDAELRHLTFKRVVFNLKFVADGEEDFIKLNDFIRNFSNSTELVMIIQPEDTENEKLFNKYFTSPIHSLAYAEGKMSIDFFKDVVTLPIADIKARYYTLDKKESQVATTKQSETGSGVKISPLRGGAKKLPESSNTTVAAPNDTEPMSKVPTASQNVYEEPAARNASETAQNMPFNSMDVDPASKESTEVSRSFDDGRVSLGTGENTGDNFVEDDSEDDLSLGAFGSRHTDTGIFDDDENPESDEDLQAYIKNSPESVSRIEAEEDSRRSEVARQNAMAEAIQRGNGSIAEKVKEPIINAVSESVSRNRCAEMVLSSGMKLGSINVVTGVTGSGATQFVVDEAYKIAKSGKSVLIVDLDYKRNGILSFIDMCMFYSRPNYNGFVHRSFYEEDGVKILSGGYGYIPPIQVVTSVVSEMALSNFDIVIVDCPLDCIELLEDVIGDNWNVIVCSGSDISNLYNTSYTLSDRDYCSVSMERRLSRCIAHVVDYNSEDVNAVKGTVFFANGCWLDGLK